MTRVKICGITSSDDALAASDAGADALGFILVPGSPRYVGDREDLARLATRLPPFITRVGVTRRLAEIPAHWLSVIDAAQCYDAPVPGANAPLRTVQAFRIKDSGSLNEIAATLGMFEPAALLLDTYHKEMLGGSGQAFDWSVAAEARERFSLPIVLAGGLCAENVSEAIRSVQPYAVDVSSGVEHAPGRKDHQRVRAFIAAVRKADAQALY